MSEQRQDLPHQSRASQGLVKRGKASLHRPLQDSAACPHASHTHPQDHQYLPVVIYGIYRQAVRATSVCVCVCGQQRDTEPLNPDLTAHTPPCHHDTMQQCQAQSYRPPMLKEKSKNAITQTQREEEGLCKEK